MATGDEDHLPYKVEEPPLSADPYDLREYLSRELKRIENAFNGVDLDVETRWDDLRVPVTSARLGGTNDPGFEKLLDNGGGSRGVFVYKFAPFVKNEELFFTAQMPHAWKEKTIIKPHFHWTVEHTASSTTVVFGLEYARANVNTAFPATTQIIRVTATPGVILQHNVTGLGDITASDGKISMQFVCRFFREQSNGGDTFDHDVSLLEIDFHYQLDSHGSRKEYIK